MITRRALQGIMQSVFMLAGFTAFWAAFLFWGFGFGPISVAGCACFLACAVWIARKAVLARRGIAALPDSPATEADKQAKKRWSVIFTVQGVTSGASCAILGILGKYEYIVPVVALIVGLHYIPIGMQHKDRIHVVAGALLSLIAIAGIAAMLAGRQPGPMIGMCALAAAASTVALGLHLLRFIDASMNSLKR